MARQPAHRLPTSPTHRSTPKKSRRLGFGIAAGTTAVALAAFGLPALAATAATTYAYDKQIASDTFTRTQSNGWGTATIGGAYSVTSPKSFSANGSVGVAAVPSAGASLTASLPAATTTDADISTVVSVPAVPTTGNGVYAGVQLRSANGSYYQARIRVNPKAQVLLSIIRVNGSTANQSTLAGEKIVASGATAGQKIAIDFRVTGTGTVVADAKAWFASQATPAWQLTASDSSASRLAGSGAVGLWTYVSAKSSAVPVSFDNVAAFSLKTVTAGTPTTPPATTTPTPTPTPTATATPAPPVAPTQPVTPPTTTPTVPTAGDPSINMAGTRKATGAAAIGSTSYAVPAGAVFAAPGGSDVSGNGSQAAPYATLQHAIDKAPAGGTVVLRAGSYHESVTISKALTVQAYPHEAVWLDGTEAVSNWAQSGTAWAATGWNHVFDSSPTYTRGAPDSTVANWQWINPAYPMAAHPDQLWVGGVAQQQVASRSQVTAGTFYYDTAAHVLYTGTNPAGKSVRASSLIKAISIGSTGVTLRGFGVKGYAPSVPDMGAVTDWKGNFTVENVAILDNATGGMSIGGTGVTLRNVTSARNGLLGVQANYADNLYVSGLLVAGNNAEHFNSSPVSGGIKVTRSRGVTVTNSAALRNFGQGIWMDESTYNTTITNNDTVGNDKNGIVLEISAKTLIANNVATGNGNDGIKIDNVSDVNIWNNTLTGNVRNLDITADARRGDNASDAGHDPRQVFPDPTMTWINGPFTIRNNVMSAPTANCLLCATDSSHLLSATQMKISSDHNLYQRPSASAPTWFGVWSLGAGNPAVYNTLDAFTAATGQEAHGSLVQGAALAPSQYPAIAEAIPAAVAQATGRTSGEVHLGAW
jgi:parallel beta-helix repeat protein